MYDDTAIGEPRTSGTGRVVAAVVWTVLLLGLWLWGRALTDGTGPPPPPEPGGASVAGRAPDGVPGAPDRADAGRALPASHAPLPDSEPERVDIDAIGVHARIVERGLDRDGAIEPPPMDTPDVVGWYGDGPAPGAEGAALLVGHLDTDTGRAVFHRLTSVGPGTAVHVTRADGTVAEFTVENVSVAERADFDPEKVYGTRRDGRAELRLITCTGTFDRDSDSYTANLVVSAYLTGVRPASGADTGEPTRS
ncbi:class F sortase [Streptomyces megasporus]|uniref:class F sortase n=1 Tax=Streptomyces megasporus TaxID=44060 RepID=UPI000AEFB773|nr:class F sortase [Streptomyces megasporus]